MEPPLERESGGRGSDGTSKSIGDLFSVPWFYQYSVIADSPEGSNGKEQESEEAPKDL